MADFKFISSDGHLNDPPEAWERVQKEYGERAPRVVNDLPDKKGLWLVTEGLKPSPCYNPSVGFLVDKPEGVTGMTVDQVNDDTISRFRDTFRYEDHPGSWQPAARLKEQDRDDVEAEQFAFALQGILLGFHQYSRLLADPLAAHRARQALDALFDAARP